MIEQIQFGTDGIRGPISDYPFTINGIATIATGIAQWFLAQHKPVRCIIARDTRPTGIWIENIFRHVFNIYNISYECAGIIPTPAACNEYIRDQADYAIIISASHNPVTDNGIKILATRYGKLTALEQESLQNAINTVLDTPDCLPLDSFQHEPNLSFKALYTQNLQNRIERSWLHNALTNQSIILDTAHGAAHDIARAVLQKTGATIIGVDEPLIPEHINARCGSTAPEAAAALVKKYNAIVGVTLDGDADRLILIDQYGNIRNGDDILILLSNHPRYQQQQTIVSTTMANYGIDDYFNAQSKTVYRTPVGDAYVAQACIALGNTIGSEPSGHCILMDQSPTSDGLITLINCLEQLYNNNFCWPEWKAYAQKLTAITVSRPDLLSMKAIQDEIQEAQTAAYPGRVHLRYSGTEKLLLRILVESKDENICDNITDNLIRIINNI